MESGGEGAGEGWKVEVEGDIYIPMSSIASM